MDKPRGLGLFGGLKVYDLGKFAAKAVTEWTPHYRERAEAKRARRRRINLRLVMGGALCSTVGVGMSGAPVFKSSNRPTGTPWKRAR